MCSLFPSDKKEKSIQRGKIPKTKEGKYLDLKKDTYRYIYIYIYIMISVMKQ